VKTEFLRERFSVEKSIKKDFSALDG